MNIEEKLQLSQKPVNFIVEGSFLKVYNQSFYVVQQLLGFKLKAAIKYIKKIDQIIVCGGFPAAAITKRYPNATPTLTGYELISHYDLSGYDKWYESQCQLFYTKTGKSEEPKKGAESHVFEQQSTQQQSTQQQSAEQSATSTNHANVMLPLSPLFTASEPISEAVVGQANKPLTVQHLLFLQSWQANKYPAIVDSAFIQALKNYFCD
jgi:hypothetical protein